MSHPEQIHFLALTKEALPEFFTGCRVLEVGSLDINGAARTFFTDCDYVGLDIGHGPGVDIAVHGEDFDAPDGSFDVVVSCECMEHNPEWAATCRNMMRMLRPGGLFLLTCAAPGRKEHGTTRSGKESSPLTVGRGQEYYENLYETDFAQVANFFDAMPLRSSWLNWAHYDYYLAGIKARSVHPGWNSYTASVDAWLQGTNRSPKTLGKQIVLKVAGKRGLAAARRALP
jgi:SAM-dependent methyltransferase